MPVIMNGITSPWCLGYRRGLRKAVSAVDGGVVRACVSPPGECMLVQLVLGQP